MLDGRFSTPFAHDDLALRDAAHDRRPALKIESDNGEETTGERRADERSCVGGMSAVREGDGER